MKFKLPLIFTLALLLAAPVFSADAQKDAATPPAKEKAASETGYWITTSSGIRHNSKCRYYKNSKGHFCAKDEGRACKICGG